MKYCGLYITSEEKVDTTYLVHGEKQQIKRRLLGIDNLKFDTFEASFIEKVCSGSDRVYVGGTENTVDENSYKFGFDTLFDNTQDITKLYSLLLTKTMKLVNDSKCFFEKEILDDINEENSNNLEFRQLDILMLYSLYKLYNLENRATIIDEYKQSLTERRNKLMGKIIEKHGYLSDLEITKMARALKEQKDASLAQDIKLLNDYKRINIHLKSGIKVIKDAITFIYRLETIRPDSETLAKSNDYYFIHLNTLLLGVCIAHKMSYSQAAIEFNLQNDKLIDKGYRLNILRKIMKLKQANRNNAIAIEIKDRDTSRAQMIIRLFKESNGKIILSECNSEEIQLAIHNTVDIDSAVKLIDKVFTEAGYGEHLSTMAIFNGEVKATYIYDKDNPFNFDMKKLRQYNKRGKFNGKKEADIVAYKEAVYNT